MPTKKEIKESQTATTGGRKFDGGKSQYGLLPPVALEETVKVLTYGAEKYEPDNWRRVPGAIDRYFDALQRHVWAWKRGEEIDPETGLHHMAHAICCAMFICELEILNRKKDETI
jgi:hypothetical protein